MSHGATGATAGPDLLYIAAIICGSLGLLGTLRVLEGYRILEAGDGREGVRLDREHRPALVLVDISCPSRFTFARFAAGGPRIVPMYLPWSFSVVPSWRTLSGGSRLGSASQQLAPSDQESREAQRKVGGDDDRPLEKYEKPGRVRSPVAVGFDARLVATRPCESHADDAVRKPA